LGSLERAILPGKRKRERGLLNEIPGLTGMSFGLENELNQRCDQLPQGKKRTGLMGGEISRSGTGGGKKEFQFRE